MSEKRYVISELDPISVLDMNTGDTFPIADGSGFVETIVECLNTLHEENKQLQHDATILIQSNQDYRKENEQLKKDILRLMYTAEHLVNIKKLEEKWGIDYNQFISDLRNGDEHL